MPEIGAKIEHLRKQNGLSRRAFGEMTSIPEAKVQALEIGKQRVDHEALRNITKAFGVSADWLLNDDAGLEAAVASNATVAEVAGIPQDALDDFAPVPRFDVSVSAGHGSQDINESIVAHYAFSKGWLTRRNLDPKKLAVVRVSGDSMLPQLAHGDLAVIDTTDTSLRDGVTYVFRLGDDLLIKRLQILPQREVRLCSRNPDYEAISVDLDKDDLASIGRLVASMHEW